MLQTYKEDDWTKVFKELEGDSGLHYYIGRILEIGASIGQYRETAREAAKALKKVAAENKLNEVRLAEFKEAIERLAEPPEQPEQASQVETNL